MKKNININWADVTEQCKIKNVDVCGDYADWVTMAQSLHSERSTDLFPLFYLLSKNSKPDVTEQECASKWKRCANADRISIGSAIHILTKAGIHFFNLDSAEHTKCVSDFSTMPYSLVAKSTDHRYYSNNRLAQWIVDKMYGEFPTLLSTEQVVSKLLEYRVGTTKDGGTVFWQIDTEDRVRTGKIIHYDQYGHRQKDSGCPIGWAHTSLRIPDYHLKQCLYGEHMLPYYDCPIGVVESEKTAVIASMIAPIFAGREMMFVATGGYSNLTAERMQILRGRDVVVFPDTDKVDDWANRIRSLRLMFRSCSIDTRLCRLQGIPDKADLADILFDERLLAKFCKL